MRWGNEVAHSPSSASSTPSAAAKARIASSSAEVPFVQAAKHIFTAEAAPGPPSTSRTSSGPPAHLTATCGASSPERYRRVAPADRTGGPTIPPSTKCSNNSLIDRAVAGATAFASTYTPSKPSAATAWATSMALPGGHTETITSDCSTSVSRPPASVRSAASARRRVAPERPSPHHTRSPWQIAAIEAPITPGCRKPVRFMIC